MGLTFVESLPTLNPVSDLRADASQSSIGLTWVKPEDCPVTGYKIKYALKKEEQSNKEEDEDTEETGKDAGGDEEEKSEMLIEDGDVTSATITELQSGKDYMIEVYSLDGERSSEPVNITVKTGNIASLRSHIPLIKNAS